MRLSLVVKGDVDTAKKAALVHGIHAEWDGHMLYTLREYSVLTAHEQDHLRAVVWYLEDRENVPPYLRGALLHYSLVD